MFAKAVSAGIDLMKMKVLCRQYMKTMASEETIGQDSETATSPFEQEWFIKLLIKLELRKK